ncbi:hypothetical protein PLEOSDRAFT_1070484 [Pleurotus ostreatus PC15]|uniref:Uncharacterized protein n=1 Tax=Pleurotus ostreatus (strain PC15) TaxID=1137138 RepID=A0A067NWC1_PLEO1|nr:hypothetical protein PLEOSDRAFT_1070484 [Pleurotus ostreatus PC15]
MPDVRYSFPSGEVHGEEVGVVISDEDDVAVDIREEAEDVDDDALSEEREEEVLRAGVKHWGVDMRGQRLDGMTAFRRHARDSPPFPP